MINPALAEDFTLLSNNKTVFLNKAKSVLTLEKYTEFETLFSSFGHACLEHYNALLDDILARQQLDGALKAKKVDPFIAGGIGQAIGGVGAGVYTAVSSANRNHEIERQRIENAIQVDKTSAGLTYYESNVLNYYEKLIQIIYSENALSEIHQRLVSERNRQKEIKADQEKQEQHTKTAFIVSFIAWVILLIVLEIESTLLIMFLSLIGGAVTTGLYVFVRSLFNK